MAGPLSGFSTDAEADDALVLPTGVAVDREGRLAIADAGSNTVRILPPGTAAR